MPPGAKTGSPYFLPSFTNATGTGRGMASTTITRTSGALSIPSDLAKFPCGPSSGTPSLRIRRSWSVAHREMDGASASASVIANP